jgi:hypothetical protein
MINVLADCLETGNEEGARNVFDVFETLLILVSTMHSRDQPMLIMSFLGNSAAFQTHAPDG